MATTVVEPPAYVLDQIYQDRRDGPNQFMRWLRIKATGGMREVYRTKRTRRGSYAPDLAALVLVSRSISGARYNPWEDIVDLSRGRIYYWGDAKADHRRARDDFSGNRLLSQIWSSIGAERWAEIPPILHFSKEQRGTVRFTGVCALAELRDAWFEDRGKRVRNYRAELEVLPIERVPLAWIEGRRRGQEVQASLPWRLYATSGVRDRLRLHAKRVRDRDEQLPPDGTADRRVLHDLHQLPPSTFERLVVRAFRESEVRYSIEGTRLHKDGGFDFHGSLELPPLWPTPCRSRARSNGMPPAGIRWARGTSRD
ncbi:hypothetical protein [Paraliomyxa miuraensis]|uniref:hypothetical protein n=1 Tax=Paraliomyxa miuraensis TaxID=376150 RepID=UPI002255DC2F|nr:hypothetical protein [Paraliomyxa miuraensis]MCX4244206.1 hypothetical protein [Paraliomyxa miuraensis]